jgi:hypothetical protein
MFRPVRSISLMELVPPAMVRVEVTVTGSPPKVLGTSVLLYVALPGIHAVAVAVGPTGVAVPPAARL